MKTPQLADLRAELHRLGIYGFLVPRADEHLGEYVSPSAERLAFLTGFTGSAGLAIVLPDRACLFVDGRYVQQAADQVGRGQAGQGEWEHRHITDQPPSEWLAQAASEQPVGYDPWLIGEEQLARFTAAGCRMVALDPNPLDTVWKDRPAPPSTPVCIQPLALAGRSSPEKRADIAGALRDAKQDATVITDPASVAWLLNIRASDVPFTPFALGFAILHGDAHAELFMTPARVSAEVRTWLGDAVSVVDRAGLPDALRALASRTVRVDPANSPAWFARALRESGATVVPGMDPCLLPKARKNAVEQAGARVAQARDAEAVCRFLCWVEAHGVGQTEQSAADRLLALRQALPDFHGESFPAISAAGEHGAIMHYRADPATDRRIDADELYLIDSGAQFPCGTTDVTRTVWTGPGVPPDTLRDRYTRVLKGHVAIAQLRFPHGTHGAHLDSFARQWLWQAGLDFDHGTGHGVGSYLSVHEGPVSLSRLARPVPLEEGMVLSNEPGFYAPGEFGIRLENLLLVRPFAAGRAFLEFETLTLAPFDRRLIAPGLLLPHETAWLDAYHRRVAQEVGPKLSPDERAWLDQACRPLAAA